MKKFKVSIKLSTLLLAAMLLLFVVSIFASNIILKREYEKTDKSDMYWNYGKILEQPFKHLVIEGGYISNYRDYIIGNITFEQSSKPSVRVLKNWVGYETGMIKAFVRNDTLFVKFPDSKTFGNANQWTRFTTLVRIFSPELLSVDGINTSMRFLQSNQKDMTINLSKGSMLQVERLIPAIDSLSIQQRDSSVVKVVMSDKYKGKEAMKIGKVNADLEGTSTLNFGHANVEQINLTMSDSAAIVLSGQALKTIGK